MITITRAPPYLTVQDSGRKHSRDSGVPRGGAMDSFALRAANAVAGNDVDAAGLEWALGDGSITFEQDAAFAFGGAKAHATLEGRDVAPCTTVHARAGETLKFEQISGGRFLYLAIGGGIDVPMILGSRSTYRRAGLRLRRTEPSARRCATAGASHSQSAEGFHCADDLLPRTTRGSSNHPGHPR